MHANTLEQWQHEHDFSIENRSGESRTLIVLLLTAVTMVAEIIAGSVFGSMALLADGWHMGTHVAAFLIAIFAYRFARKHANDSAYTFSTGKVTVLSGFSSAIVLAVVALLMLIESVVRLFDPQVIQFNQAIFVALIGLLVNVVSAFLLKNNHDDHHHGDIDHHDHDHNLRAAYLHVLADALTSLLAIVALVAGKYYGWNWLDSIMGMVGAVIIIRWSYSLIKPTSAILLDTSIGHDYRLAVTNTLEGYADNRVSDIHIWKISTNHYAAIISLVTHSPQPAATYKALLKEFKQLSHVTIEVNRCIDSH